MRHVPASWRLWCFCLHFLQPSFADHSFPSSSFSALLSQDWKCCCNYLHIQHVVVLVSSWSTVAFCCWGLGEAKGWARKKAGGGTTESWRCGWVSWWTATTLPRPALGPRLPTCGSAHGDSWASIEYPDSHCCVFAVFFLQGMRMVAPVAPSYQANIRGLISPLYYFAFIYAAANNNTHDAFLSIQC